MTNSGQDYDLSKTSVTVENPGGGYGFLAGEIRFAPEEVLEKIA